MITHRGSTAARLGAPPAPHLASSPCGPVLREAHFCAHRRHRFRLTRTWGGGPVLPWLMLNPSRADCERDDPTIRRVMAFSRAWGFSGCLVVNVYPRIAPRPRDLTEWVTTRGPGTDEVWERIDQNAALVREALRPADAAIAAWGGSLRQASGASRLLFNLHLRELLAVLNLDRPAPLALFCLGTTNAGDPLHPMARGRHRVPDNVRPRAWEGPRLPIIGPALSRDRTVAYQAG